MKRMLLILLIFGFTSPVYANLKVIGNGPMTIGDGKSHDTNFEFAMEGYVETPCLVMMCSGQFALYSPQVDRLALAAAAPYHILNGIKPITDKGGLSSWVQVSVIAPLQQEEFIEQTANGLADLAFGSDALLGFEKVKLVEFKSDSGISFLHLATTQNGSTEIPFSKGFMWGVSDTSWFLFRIYHAGNSAALQSVAREIANRFVEVNDLKPHPRVTFSVGNFKHLMPLNKALYGIEKSFLRHPKPLYWFAGSALACEISAYPVEDMISFISEIHTLHQIYASISGETYSANPLFEDKQSLLLTPNDEIYRYRDEFLKRNVSDLLCKSLPIVWKTAYSNLQKEMNVWLNRNGDTKVSCFFEDQVSIRSRHKDLPDQQCINSGGHALPILERGSWLEPW